MSEKTKLLKDALTPDLLRQVLSNSLLKEIMTDAMAYRGSFGDLDETKDFGLYTGAGANVTGTTPTEGPKWLYGALIVFQSRQGIIQILFSDALDVAIREYKIYDLSWHPWRILQFAT